MKQRGKGLWRYHTATLNERFEWSLRSDRVIVPTQVMSDRVIATQVMSDRVIATQVMSDREITKQVLSDRVIATQVI